ncbi:MAG: TolC family protein [Bacteroidales bacterium]|nr:TolC family protein [Bacteroidales bacterium]
MKTIKKITITVLLLSSSLLSAQESLNIYLEKAAQSSPELKARFNDYMAALEKVPQTKALPDPQLAFSWFISPVETRMGPQQLKLSLSQFFPWFGTLRARENAAIENARARYELFEETRSALFKDIKGLYYNLYFFSRSIDLIKDNIELLELIGKLAEVKIEAGLVSIVDEYRIRMEINDLNNQLSLLDDKYSSLGTEFRNTVGDDNIGQIILPDALWLTDFPLSRSSALDSVLSGNHSLLSLEFRQAAREYEKEAAEKAGFPDFRIGLDYIVTGSGDDNLPGKDAFAFPSVGISIPLYRNKYKAMVNEAAYREKASRNEADNRVNALETLFENAWRDYRDADRRIRLNESQADLADSSLRLLQDQYSTNSTNFEEILRMERRLLKYKLEFEKARADKQAAIAFIYYLMGK